MYIILVGSPGSGKTAVIDPPVTSILRGLGPDQHIAPSSLTPASLTDTLNKATRQVLRPKDVPAVITYNSLSIIANELGVLIPTYDFAMMNRLQDHYDCKSYSEARRGNDLFIEIPNPQLNVLAGCTPAYLSNTMPEGAWAEGFSARCIFIYSGDTPRESLFKANSSDEKVMRSLARRLRQLTSPDSFFGEIPFTAAAREFLDSWYLGGCRPEPEHPRLYHYNTRRPAHVIKLSIIAAISEGKQVIDVPQIQRAIDWLVEAEFFMPDIFKAMTNTSAKQVLEDVYHYVYQTYTKENNKPVARARVLNFISQRVPVHQVMQVLDVLVKAGHFEEGFGGTDYKPRGKQKT